MNAIDELKPTRLVSVLTLFTTSGTLICCALPALLVALGAGAALSSLIASVPQLVWFSEHKIAVFSVAAIMLLASGLLQWRSRYLPCPADPAMAQICMRTRRQSLWLYFVSFAIFSVGGFFAFIAPWIF
jgi:hypothetical protein